MDRAVPVDGPSGSHPQKQGLITPPSSQTSPQRSWVISPSSSLLSSQVCGKRSRSNSSTSSLGSSDGGGSGTSSGFSLYSTFSSGGGSGSGSGSGSDSALSDAVESPTTSASNASSPEFERGCPSPGVAKRKIARCAKQQTACTAATAPSAASGSSQCATSAGSSDAEVTGLDGAVQAFGLSSRRQSPIDDRSSSSTSTTTTSSLLSHPSSSSSSSSSAPELPRAKVAVVDQLVDAATATLDAIWNSPLPMDEEPPEVSCSISSLPLHIFIRETLRRSRTSCSTLQAALLYCLRSAPAVRRTRLHIAHLRLQVYRTDPAAVEQIHDSLCCPRRNFLAAVMVASKFLQDKNFSNRAWSKLTGLPIKELGNVERGFLGAIGWDLNIKPNEWDSWTRKLAQARLSGDRHGNDTAEASSSANVNAMHSKCHTPAAAAAPTPPLHSAVAQLRTARSRDDQPQSSCSHHSGANSSCPTPTPSTPTASSAPSVRPPRMLLARSQSDDAPFRAFDMDAVDRVSTVNGTGKVDGAPNAEAVPTMSNRAMAEDHTDADTTATPVHSSASTSTATATDCPPPFPMPRHFVRSAASFSFAAHQQQSCS